MSNTKNNTTGPFKLKGFYAERITSVVIYEGSEHVKPYVSVVSSDGCCQSFRGEVAREAFYRLMNCGIYDGTDFAAAVDTIRGYEEKLADVSESPELTDAEKQAYVDRVME